MRGSVVAVLGGTGFIGRHVVQHLCDAGAQVRLLCRHPDRAVLLRPLGEVGQVGPLPLDVASDESLKAGLAGVDVVVNLVGILYQRKPGDFERVHAELPARIGKLAPPTARIVHVSAIGADPNARSIYASTKGRGEEALRQARPDAVILRPSVVFGPEDQFLNRFARMSVISPFLPAIGGGHTRFQPVYVRDVALAVLRATTLPDAIGRTYELGGPEVMTFRSILEWLLGLLGRNRKIVNMPFHLADLQARFLQVLPAPPLTRDQVLLLRSDNVVSKGASGLADLGIEASPMQVVAPSYLHTYARVQPRITSDTSS
jgi:NADH dehydrogenase